MIILEDIVIGKQDINALSRAISDGTMPDTDLEWALKANGFDTARGGDGNLRISGLNDAEASRDEITTILSHATKGSHVLIYENGIPTLAVAYGRHVEFFVGELATKFIRKMVAR